MLKRAAVFILLVLPVILAYYGVQSFDFVDWDDGLNVAFNPCFDGTLNHIGAFWQAAYSGLYIPVIYTIWGVMAWLAHSPQPQHQILEYPTYIASGPFHVMNLAVHLLNIGLVYLLLSRLKFGQVGSVLGAMCFGLHPLQVECVAWVTGFKDLLGGTFSLLALWCYLKASSGPSASEGTEKSEGGKVPFRGNWAVLATVSFVLALLSKPAAVVLPFVVILLEITVVHHPVRRIVAIHGLWFVLAIAAAWVTKAVQSEADRMVNLSLLGKFTVAGDSLLFYLGKFFVPTGLCVDYGKHPNDVVAQSGAVAFALVLPVVLLFLLIAVKRWPRLGLGVGIILLGLSPVLGLVSFAFQRHSTVADRYMYFPMFGVAILLALLFDSLGKVGPTARKVAVSLGAVWMIGLAFLTVGQVQCWQSSFTLFTQAAKITPKSDVAHNNLATYLDRAGRVEPAIREYQIAIELNPTLTTSMNSLGYLLREQGRFDEAIAQFEHAVKVEPTYGEAYFNLGIAYYRAGRRKEGVAAVAKSLELDPGNEAATNLIQRMRAGESI